MIVEPSGTTMQAIANIFRELVPSIPCEISGTSITVVTPARVSVTNGGITVTAEARVFQFLDEQRGTRYQPKDIALYLDTKPATVHTALRRLSLEGKIRHERRDYYVPLPPREVNPFQLTAEQIDIVFPLEVGEYARVSQGDLVVIAGEKSAGKSAFLGETAILNMPRMHVNYIATENVRKIARRFLQWGYTESEIMQHVSFIDARVRDYGNIIKPDSLNVVDYYNPSSGDFTKVSTELEQMAASLDSGILVVGLQKAKGASFARGGELSNELSQLTVSLEVVDYSMGNRIARACMRIVKESGVRKGGENRVCEYTFTDMEKGSRIIQTGSWDWPKKTKG